MPKPQWPESLQTSVLENMTVGVAVYAPDSRVLFANDAACALLGLSPKGDGDEWAADPKWTFVGEDGGPLALEGTPIAQVLAGSQEVRDLVIGVDRPGADGRVWVLAGASPVFGETGRMDHVVVALTDITVRLKTQAGLEALQSELIQAQKTESLGQLAEGLAHDFNNILMVQKGYCDMMRMQLKEDDPLAESLGQIETYVERGIELVRELMSFGRQQTTEPEVVDFNYLLEDLNKVLQAMVGEGIELATVFASHPATVMAVRAEIEQMLMNLVVNARDAMPQGGKLNLHVSWTELDESMAAGLGVSPGSYVRLAVTDTGQGMDADAARALFEPYAPGAGGRGGSGLGLSASRELARQSGGAIRVDTEPGKGTTLEVYLPRVELSGARATGGPGSREADSKGYILVVEDEPALRGLVVMMLERLGYRVREAATGGDALKLVDDERRQPDLVLTDLVLPGISGSVMAEQLKAKMPDLKCIFMSGYADQAILGHGVTDASVDFLRKPFAMADLEAKVKSVIGPPKP